MLRSLKAKFVRVLDAFTLSESLLFFFSLILFGIAVLGIVYKANASLMVEVPQNGGTHIEGFVGAPRSIHPLFAVTDTDKDLVSLVYSGLLRANPDGTYTPDLAESYTISEDGKTYTFTLREDAVFHDGTPVTTEDVAYTIGVAQDPEFKSPKRAVWEGVLVTVISPREIQLTIGQPYGGFLTNTTLGIVPKHLWSSVSAEEMTFSRLNTRPVGSGPYKFSTVELNESGLPTMIKLKAFNKFVLGKPHISTFIAKFYPNEKERLIALDAGEITAAAGISEDTAAALEGHKKLATVSSPLNRLFGVFLNQNNAPVLAHKEIRTALSQAIDRKALVDAIFLGYGTELKGPIPSFESQDEGTSTQGTAVNSEEILAQLAKSGWTIGSDGVLAKKSERVAFSISTSNNADLVATANMIADMWKKIGVQVEIKSYEPAQFNLNVIRPREYQGLLFGITMGRELDYYAFWHSSQRNDPGLNIALYTNARADKLLESGRTESDPIKRKEAEKDFAAEVTNDVPVVFLYSPYYLYATETLNGYDMNGLRTAGDRFYDIHKWYIETDRVWKFLFVQDK
jgi:peptide/nickel transport system substrate-binding protein